MSFYIKRSLRLITFSLVTLTGAFYFSARADAAESVVLKYRFLRGSVSVPELVTFAKTGELSNSLKSYLRLAGREPEELRRVLTQEVKVNPNLLSGLLNSPVGEVMLDQVSEVVHTPTNRANRESLRGALVSSALSDGRITFSLVTLTGAFYFSARADAAESVVLKYRFLRGSVSVPELVTFAKTGELSNSLKSYLRLAGREPEELRRVLTQEVKVNPNLLSGLLNSPVGEVMLDQVSEVVHTPTNRANRESLRGALVSSALSDGRITLIETLENYPTPEVHVEGERLVEVAQKFRDLFGRLPNLRL